MKIYKVYRTDNVSYDEYDSYVVVAETPDKAVAMCKWETYREPQGIKVTEIKAGKKSRVILASFNAG